MTLSELEENTLLTKLEKETKLFLNRKRLLGKGGYSKVFQAKTEKGMEYAVKLIGISDKNENKENARYKSQLAFHDCKFSTSAKHKSFIHSFGYYKLSKYSYAIVMNKATGNFKTIISTFFKEQLFGNITTKFLCYKKMSNSLIRFFFNQIINSMMFLFENDWVHFDIKPENLLLFNQELKLSDFSLTDLVPKIGKYELLSSGTFSYMPPEYFNVDREINAFDADKIDVFAIGCILFKLITNKDVINKDIKYSELTKENLINTINNSLFFLKTIFKENKYENDDNRQLFNLINKMLKPDNSQRISMKELIENGWRKKNEKKINQIKEIHVNYYIKVLSEIQKADSLNNIQKRRKKFTLG
jgi:serine/threonine protein kinase